ncbi:hypothetical protein QCA50_002553 [Cerrena zonata]|uniref:Protein kinase domain-containing protein n=1 Tax=Cerrena zonata TaxID=2478898 RepID=A0AAW0GPF4_9APHY
MSGIQTSDLEGPRNMHQNLSEPEGSLIERLLDPYDDIRYEAQSELVALRGADARNALDELQKYLDLQYAENQTMSSETLGNRRRLYWIMLTAAERSQQFPPSLFVRIPGLSTDILPICGGISSNIYLGQYKSATVAVRQIRSHSVQSLPRMRLFYECLKWRQLRHPNIVPLFGIDVTFSRYPGLIQPWYKNDHIRSYISKLPTKPSSEQLNQWLTEIASGMTYLHSWAIWHGDLRGNNVFIDDEGVAKVSDIVLAPFREEWTAVQKPYSQVQRWLAPEIFVSPQWDATTAGDVYAFGCMAIELYTGEVPPFPAAMQGNAAPYAKYPDGDLPPRPENMPDDIWNLTRTCWHLDPRERLPMFRIVQILTGDPQCIYSPADIAAKAEAAIESRQSLADIYIELYRGIPGLVL